jgi:hypothetical protein
MVRPKVGNKTWAGGQLNNVPEQQFVMMDRREKSKRIESPSFIVGDYEINHHGLRWIIQSPKWTLEVSADARRSIHHRLDETDNLMIWRLEDARNHGPLVQRRKGGSGPMPCYMRYFDQSGEIMAILLSWYIEFAQCESAMFDRHSKAISATVALACYISSKFEAARMAGVQHHVLWKSKYSMEYWTEDERITMNALPNCFWGLGLVFRIVWFSMSWCDVIFRWWQSSCYGLSVSFCDRLTLFRKCLRLMSCEALNSEFWIVSRAKPKLFCVLGPIIKNLLNLSHANFHPYSHCIISEWSPAWFPSTLLFAIRATLMK